MAYLHSKKKNLDVKAWETQPETRQHTGIMEKKMETATLCWGHIGIMEKKMETTTVHLLP